MPKKKILLTHEEEAAIVAEYAETGSPQVADAMGLPRSRFYRILRRHGIEPMGKGRALDTARHPRCVVCGDPIGGWGKSCPSGAAYYSLTCKDPMCKTEAKLRPHLVPAERLAKWQKNMNPNAPSGSSGHMHRWWERKVEELSRTTFDNREEVVRFLADFLPGYELPWLSFYELSEDRRGAARTGAHEVIWSDFSRRTPFARLTSREGATGIFLRLGEGESAKDVFLQKYLGSAAPLFAEVLPQFDPFLTWRCCCPAVTTYELPSLDDFPKVVGLYGLCPQCGAAAIEIKRRKGKR